MSIIRSNKLPAISPGKVLQKLLKQNNLSTSESAKLLDLSLGAFDIDSFDESLFFSIVQYPEHGTIEVGHINYSPILQNTAEGTETMYLMMKNAFDHLGYRRYEWKCNNLNLDSKKASKRLGFKFEGIFRQSFIVKKRNRDTAWFSVIDKEWKKYIKKYQKYLNTKNFDKNLNQKIKLKLV